MVIIGGTYREICKEPFIDSIYGSGLRAAFAISRGCDLLEFVSIVYGDEKKEVETLEVIEEIKYERRSKVYR